MNIKIDKLKNHPNSISILAKLWYDSLGQWEPDTSLSEINQWFNEWLNDGIPLALVALVDNKPVGMCSIQLTDGIRPELKPWLGDLCVSIDYQCAGIGKRLIESAKNIARKEGYSSLYLLAPDATMPQYYTRLGWHCIGVDEYKGHPVTSMEINLID